VFHAAYSLVVVSLPQKGVVNPQAQQDANLPPERRYIRRIIAIPMKNLACHDEDDFNNCQYFVKSAQNSYDSWTERQPS
jgi:hypothetical protein